MKLIESKLDLRGRTALITGAGGHIGRVICQALSEMGANPLLVDRPGNDLAPLCEELAEHHGVEARAYNVDLESQDDRVDLCNRINSADETLDILVNNAAFVGDTALTGWVEPFYRQSTEAWSRALEVNLTAVFEMTRLLGPKLSAGSNGSVVNVASIYGINGPDWSLYENTAMGNPAAYAASKGGLLQLTRWLATTLAPSIRVNAISPGGVFRNQPESFVERYRARTPLGRMAHEEDFAGAVAFLASDLSAYVTGQNIVVDGGWSVW